MDRRGWSVLLFLALCFLTWSPAAGDNIWDLSVEEDKELEIELQTLNKPFVKSFKDKYGITYDCVDIYNQPAFDHPLLKNHTLQMKATWLPKYNDNTNRPSTKQVFPKRCPTGTIVIRRTTKEDLIRARKYTHQIQSGVQPLQEQMADTTSGGAFHYARVSIDAGKGPKYYGASADLDVFQLSGVSENQASTSQIILSKGERGPRNYINSVQAGWHVNYQREGDNSTHFFTYWTSDGSQKTGCYNLVCKGFVQISTRLAPGMIYTQSSLSLSIYRDRFTLNWMLYNDREPVGYWPKEIFNNMADCSQVQMGGDVYSPLGEPSPPMGSGVLNEAKFTRVLLTDGRGNDIKVKEYTTINDLPNYIYGVTSDLQTLTYGGPGGWRKA